MCGGWMEITYYDSEVESGLKLMEIRFFLFDIV